MKIVKINGLAATAIDHEGNTREINISAVAGAKENDWVLASSGFAVNAITKEEAEEIINIFPKEEGL